MAIDGLGTAGIHRMRADDPAEVAETGCAVDIVGVSKTFGELVAVRDVSLPIRKGEFITLLGPSGCGKTTLLNIVAGFEAPDSGKVCIDAKDMTRVPPYRRDTGMVFQSYALFPHMNVFDNVAFGLRMRRIPKAQIANAVRRTLAMVKLESLEQRRVRQLSGGQQQRVALARAIIIRPKVLLLDEPLSALDKNLRAEMQVELKELHRETGLTTLFVTHDQSEALSLADRIVVMNRGEVQQVSTPLDLYRRPVNGFVASFIGEINALPPARCTVREENLLLDFAADVRLVTRRPANLRVRDGQTIRLFVRPEQVALACGEVGRQNVVKGRITTHIYQGAYTVTRLEVAGLGLVQLRSGGGDVIECAPPGSEVAIAVDLDQAVMIAE
jgi:spermidine/putrescine ABC transporter ATP-binding subunit